MKISKIAKILQIALAFTVCSSFAADDPSINSASVDYTLTVKDYVKITEDPGTVKTSAVEYGTDYSTVTMKNQMATTFNIITNAQTRDLLLAGTCNPGDENAIKFVDETHFNLVFTNSTIPPLASSVQNITGTGTLDPDMNPNAIAFGVTLTPSRDHGAGADVDDPSTAIDNTEWDASKKGIKYTVKNGHIKLAYQIDKTNVADTFNTQDMKGTYTAKLTLTNLTSP